MIKVFTAFSGYDSQCMALDRLHDNFRQFNYELVGWSEIDKFAIKAHNAIFPQYESRNFGDISKINWEQVPNFDLFTYSSPCQDFSQAGRQKGGEVGSGTRSSLLWECERAIASKKPKYLLFENVSALVSQKFINTFQSWQVTLESYGYANFAKVLNAKNYGVPQNRERIFMISILNSDKRFMFPEELPLLTLMNDFLEKTPNAKYILSDRALNFYIKNNEKQKNKGFRFIVSNGGTVARTITTKAGGRMEDNFIRVGEKVRKLTPRECFRLMGVSDVYINAIQGSKISDTQQYKMAGNSIVVDVLYWLFYKLFINTKSESNQLTIFDV